MLATKFVPPMLRAGAVDRPELLARLANSPSARLVLLAAPAGSGKTTALAQWLASVGNSATAVAWVSLDPTDADPLRFWTHTLTAIEQLVPGAGAPGADLLSAPHPPKIEDVLNDCVNALVAHPHEMVLIVDDYHLVDGAGAADEIHRGIAYLVDHLPHQVRVVLSTRSDPPLPLARLRARGELVEVRASDLGLTTEQTHAFLTDTMALDLSKVQSDVLHMRTEGWVAGLQLAGLALRQHEAHPERIDAFIKAFAGSDRFVIDYLAQEVLDGQPEEVLEFLSRTCILDRLCGPLCDALYEDSAPGAGQERIEALERDNLFLAPLDTERRWFRYHRLFVDVVRARVRSQRGPDSPDDATLHQRAAAWFERSGMISEAVSHARAAGDPERVADLVESVHRLQFVMPTQAELRGWVDALPDELIRRRPRLALIQAWRLLQDGNAPGAEELVTAAERALASTDLATASNLGGEISVIRGFLALGHPMPRADEVMEEAEGALTQLDPDNTTFRGMAHMTIGHAATLKGEGHRAERAFVTAVNLGRTADAPHVAVMASVYLVAVQRLHGRYVDALVTAREAIDWSARHRTAAAGRVGLLHLLTADLVLESGDLNQAAEHASRGMAGARLSGLPAMLAIALLVQARVLTCANDHRGALAALGEAQALIGRAVDLGRDEHTGPPTVSGPSAAWEACGAQVFLASGDLAPAVRWADRQAWTSPDSLLAGARPGSLVLAAGYECEHVRIAPAQIRIAQARASGDAEPVRRALELLDAQRAAIERFGLGWLRIKALTLRALALADLGEATDALRTLQQALQLAEPEGHVRLFAQEGVPMAALLTRVRQARARGTPGASLGYIEKILRSCASQTSAATLASGPALAAAPTSPVAPLVEPLTDRELEVLQLIADGLGNADVARTLHVAPSTVKSHVNHLFTKLGVASRTQAIARARELGLL